jgi:hypothetical protein
MPILSPNDNPRTSGYTRYQDDAVTSKTPKSSECESSDAEENTSMQCDTESEIEEVVEFTPTDSIPERNNPESGGGEVVEFTPTDPNPKGASTLQKSKSLELNTSQANRALGTFKTFNSQELKKNPTSSPKNASKEVEGSTQMGQLKKNSRQGKRKVIVESHLDADDTKTISKPLTRSREKAIASQSQTTNVQTARAEHVIVNTQVGNGSSLTITRKLR